MIIPEYAPRIYNTEMGLSSKVKEYIIKQENKVLREGNPKVMAAINAITRSLLIPTQ